MWSARRLIFSGLALSASIGLGSRYISASVECMVCEGSFFVRLLSSLRLTGAGALRGWDWWWGGLTDIVDQ